METGRRGTSIVNPVPNLSQSGRRRGHSVHQSDLRQIHALHHIFDRVCDENGIGQRLTKLEHPWTKKADSVVE